MLQVWMTQQLNIDNTTMLEAIWVKKNFHRTAHKTTSNAVENTIGKPLEIVTR